jgi:phosphoribosylformylglycinamidine synthase
MMSALRELIPGAQGWPRFVKNRSEQFEARLALVEVAEGPSIFFRGMAGSRLPVVTAHGEGRAALDEGGAPDAALVTLRFVDGRGRTAELYPANPNGSPGGITGLTTPDGRFTIVMARGQPLDAPLPQCPGVGRLGRATSRARAIDNGRRPYKLTRDVIVPVAAHRAHSPEDP